jgi:hypothetical protein
VVHGTRQVKQRSSIYLDRGLADTADTPDDRCKHRRQGMRSRAGITNSTGPWCIILRQWPLASDGCRCDRAMPYL